MTSTRAARRVGTRTVALAVILTWLSGTGSAEDALFVGPAGGSGGTAASDRFAGEPADADRSATLQLTGGEAPRSSHEAAEESRPATAGRGPQPHVDLVEEGSSSRRTRNEAIACLPVQHLSGPQVQAVREVLDSISIFRRLPAFRCELDPRVHEFFTRHPDVAASIWRAMAISQLQMWQTGPTEYEIDTRDGTVGTITVLHYQRESGLVLCDGLFKSPYLKNAIDARSLMHLRTSFVTDAEGRTYAVLQADLFVSFPSQKIETVARLISPVSNLILDRNFEEISLFVHVMWLAMSRQPGWVERMASGLEGILPGRKEELLRLTADVYVAAQADLRRRAGLPATLPAIRPPSSGRDDQAVPAGSVLPISSLPLPPLPSETVVR
jgi:hypothetical protein